MPIEKITLIALHSMLCIVLLLGCCTRKDTGHEECIPIIQPGAQPGYPVFLYNTDTNSLQERRLINYPNYNIEVRNNCMLTNAHNDSTVMFYEDMIRLYYRDHFFEMPLLQ
jgi:hypothetical protein